MLRHRPHLTREIRPRLRQCNTENGCARLSSCYVDMKRADFSVLIMTADFERIKYTMFREIPRHNIKTSRITRVNPLDETTCCERSVSSLSL